MNLKRMQGPMWPPLPFNESRLALDSFNRPNGLRCRDRRLLGGANMELEGNLIVRRKPTRRWVSVLVVTPVLACIAGVTLFIRAYVSPPTISIPSPMSPAAALLADPIQVEPTPPIRVEASAETPTAPAQTSGSAEFVAAPAFPAPTWPAEAAPATGMTVVVPVPQPGPRRTMARTDASAVPLPHREREPAETSAPQPPEETRSVSVSQSNCALMQRLAQQHSNDMARRESLDHSGFHSRAMQGARAENVAMGNRTRAETMAQWRASAGHAANMRLPGCKAVAYAVSKSGRHYWTMEIGQSPAEKGGAKAAGRLRAVPSW